MELYITKMHSTRFHKIIILLIIILLIFLLLLDNHYFFLQQKILFPSNLYFFSYFLGKIIREVNQNQRFLNVKRQHFCYCCWGFTYSYRLDEDQRSKVIRTLNIDNYYKTAWSTSLLLMETLRIIEQLLYLALRNKNG